LTVTVTVEGVPAVAVPDAGLSVSQLALSLAVQLAEPALTLIVNVLGGGVPGLAMFLKKFMLVGFSVIVGELVTVKVTGIVLGELLAFGEVIVMLAEYTPTARPVLLTDTVSVDGAVPDAGLILSQLALSLAVQFNTPTGVVMETV
jgi:hypothetical protein